MPSDFEKALTGGSGTLASDDGPSDFEKALSPGPQEQPQSDFEAALSGAEPASVPAPATAPSPRGPVTLGSLGEAIASPFAGFIKGPVAKEYSRLAGGRPGKDTPEGRRLAEGEYIKALGEKLGAVEKAKELKHYSPTFDELRDYEAEVNKAQADLDKLTSMARELPVKPPPPGVPGKVLSGIDAILGVAPRAVTGALLAIQEGLQGEVAGTGEGLSLGSILERAASAGLGSFAEDPSKRATSGQLFQNITKAAAGGKITPEFLMRNPGYELLEKVGGAAGDILLGGVIPPYGAARMGAMAPHVVAGRQVSKVLGVPEKAAVAAAKEAFVEAASPMARVERMAETLKLAPDQVERLAESLGPGGAGLGKRGLESFFAKQVAEASPGTREAAESLVYGAGAEPGFREVVRGPAGRLGLAGEESGQILDAIRRAIPDPKARESLGGVALLRQDIAEAARLRQKAWELHQAGNAEAADRALAKARDYELRLAEQAEAAGLRMDETGLPALAAGQSEVVLPGGIKVAVQEAQNGLVIPSPVGLTKEADWVWTGVREMLDDFNKAELADDLLHGEVAQYMPEYYRKKGSRKVSLDKPPMPAKESFRRAKDPGHSGGDRILDIAEYAALRHRAHAVAMANAEAEREVLKAFGREIGAKESWLVGPTGGGELVKYTGKFGANRGKEFWLEENTFNQLERLVSPKVASNGLESVDNLLRYWKGLATIGKGPGFAVRNMASNLMNMVAAGVDPLWVGRMASALLKHGGMTAFGPVEGAFLRGLRKFGGLGGDSFKVAGLTPQEVLALARKEGVIEAGFYATEIGGAANAGKSWFSSAWNPLSREFAPARFTGRLNEGFERVSKLAVFADRLAKGWTPKEAAKYAMDVIFSMREVPKGIETASRVLPFIRWNWKQWGFNATRLLSDPKVFYRYAQILEGAQELGDNEKTAAIRKKLAPLMDLGTLMLPSEHKGEPVVNAYALGGFSGLSAVDFFNPDQAATNALRMFAPYFSAIMDGAKEESAESELRQNYGTLSIERRQKVKPYTFISRALDWMKENRPGEWLAVVRTGVIEPHQPGRVEYIQKLLSQGVPEAEANARAMKELPVSEYRWDADIPQYLQWVAPQLASTLNLFKPNDESAYEVVKNYVFGIKGRPIGEAEANWQGRISAQKQKKPYVEETSTSLKTGL